MLSHRICTGLPRRRLGKLIEELAGPWLAQQEGRLRERRGHERLRAAGAGPDRGLVFTDRVIATRIEVGPLTRREAVGWLGTEEGVGREGATLA
ncbi:IS5/IS1182 family transposase, partial [Streptomyces griseorubiginosus]